VTRVTASRLGMRSPWRMHTQRTSQADARCVSLMRAQDGLISRDQLELEGLGEAARRRRVRAGLLVPILPGVYRSLVTTESWRQFVRATWMWLRGRGVLSHLTSASLLGLVENEPLPIEVTSSLSSLKPPSDRVVVHRVKQLEQRDIRVIHGMSITTPVRTIVDLAGSLPQHRFEFVLDEARRRRLVAERPLREALDRLGIRGRPGIKALRSILDSGELQRPVPGSPFERRFIQFLVRRRLPMAERQFVIEDHKGNFVARVDFAYPDLKVAIECDGRKDHFGVGDWEKDVVRRSKLAALGWLVIHVSWHMLVHETDEVERLIRDAIGQPSLL
jgi:very-short-patch-repair endonuclease